MSALFVSAESAAAAKYDARTAHGLRVKSKQEQQRLAIAVGPGNAHCHYWSGVVRRSHVVALYVRLAAAAAAATALLLLL